MAGRKTTSSTTTPDAGTTTPERYDNIDTGISQGPNAEQTHEDHTADGPNLITPVRTSEGSIEAEKDVKEFPEGPHAAGVQAIVSDQEPTEPNEREKAEAERLAREEKQRQANLKEAEKNIKPARREENGVIIDEAVQT